MRIARSADEELRAVENVHGGAGQLNYNGHWGRNDFETPWYFVHSGSIPPGGGIGHHRHVNCEEMFVTSTTPRSSPTTAGPFRLRGAPAADRIPLGRFDRSLLSTHSDVHQGKGDIGVRMIWQHSDFRTNWCLAAHVLMPPQTSIGYHRHVRLEETYVVVNGSGRMTVDDETEEVQAGDSIPNKLGGSHGLYNHTREELELFVNPVTMERGQADSEDFGDDLLTR